MRHFKTKAGVLLNAGATSTNAAVQNARDERRYSLIQAAYAVIAAEGFEGLRTRRVAERAEVNVATLHYYFPTKEALVAGVAEYLAAQFITVHAAPVPATGSPALDRLRQEFADARYYLRERSDLMTVLLELTLRARRDKAIERLVAPLWYHWRAGIERFLAEGVAAGVFKADLQPRATAARIAAVISGSVNLALTAAELDELCAELERDIVAAKPVRSPKRRAHK